MCYSRHKSAIISDINFALLVLVMKTHGLAVWKKLFFFNYLEKHHASKVKIMFRVYKLLIIILLIILYLQNCLNVYSLHFVVHQKKMTCEE